MSITVYAYGENAKPAQSTLDKCLSEEATAE